jgi:hypothetical protein
MTENISLIFIGAVVYGGNAFQNVVTKYKLVLSLASGVLLRHIKSCIAEAKRTSILVAD